MDNSEYIIRASDINISEKRLNSHTNIRRALRECINPLYSQADDIKKLKGKNKIEGNKFKCPRCSNIVTYLELAHIGESAYTMIDKIINENPTDNYSELANKVHLYHKNNVTFAVVCRKCNNQLGDKQSTDN